MGSGGRSEERDAADSGPRDSADEWGTPVADAVRAAVEHHGIRSEGLQVTARHLTDTERWIRLDDVHGASVTVWAAQVHGHAPQGSHPIHTPIGEFGMWRHPNDPALPGLRVALAPGALSTAGPAEMIALTPLDRAVVRLGAPGHSVIVKVQHPGPTTHATADILTTLHAAGLPVPRVLSSDVPLGLVVMEDLPGATLADHLAAGGPGPSGDELFDLLDRLAEVDLGRSCPTEPLTGTPSATVPGTIHGDLHDRQILVDHVGRIVGLLDVDRAGWGDRLDDVGCLLAHVFCRDRLRSSHARAGDAWCAAVLATADRRTDGRNLRARTAVGVRKLAKRWGDHAVSPEHFRRACLDLIEKLLS